ncbi:MAG: phosphate ABC transporter substrate-binding protein PstS [Limnochordaceae bacterium]|nr:phosphate ABC transporter substrate-binding protein PstS [Limnochordaceae bacterium]
MLKKSSAWLRWTVVSAAIASLAAATILVAGNKPSQAAGEVTLTGAGATFPQPIYSKWFYEYNRIHPDIRINYQGIGSGGGIQQITQRTIDFGASDAPMTEEEMAKAPGILHIPTVIGAVVPTYNLPGIRTTLHITGTVLADIYLGKITRWNDPRLTSLNPGVKLPNLPIAVVHRSDGSGTTNIFTSYLTAVSAEWAKKVGAGKSVDWPVGRGGKGNPGVAALVGQTPGAIGYVELAYVHQNNLPYILVQNRNGKYVEPSVESTIAAAAGAINNMPADFRATIVNSPGDNVWPIAGFTWLLIYRDQKDPVKGKALVDFVKWALTQGDQMAEALDYAPLPDSVQNKVLQALDTIRF